MAERASASMGPDAQDIAEAMEAMKAYHRADVWVTLTAGEFGSHRLSVAVHAVLLAPKPMQPASGLKVSAEQLFMARTFPHPDHKTLEGCISYLLNSMDYKMAKEFWEQMPLDYLW